MKEISKAWFSFNKPERMGLIVLLSILLLLIAIRLLLHCFVRNDVSNEEERRLVQAWETFKAENKISEKYAAGDTPHKPVVKTKPGGKAAIHKNTSPKLFPFDPNSIDSAGLRRLGLREKTTSIFLHWRAKGKVFYKKEELRKVYTLTEEEYLRLEPYIKINDRH